MSHLSRTLSGLAFLCALAAPCFAASSPWDGSWKLNEAKSHLTGDAVRISESGGMYAISSGSFTDKFACDGKPYPTMAGRMTACTKTENGYDTVATVKGKELYRNHHVISADGKTMQVTSNTTRPDGVKQTDETTYAREGAGKGMVGTWKDVKTSSNAPATMLLKVNGDKLRLEDPQYKAVSETKLDGTPGAITGPTVPAGVMYATKAEGNNKVKETVTLNGKVVSEGMMTLSADGKTLTDVTWSPEKPDEKQTSVYDKQ